MMMAKRLKDRYDNTEKPHFHFVNPNPWRRSTADCVIRAMSLFLGWSWTDTLKDLSAYCINHGHMPNYYSGYKDYLVCQAFGGCKAPEKPCTVKEFLDNYTTKGTSYLVVISKHMTCIKDGRINDTWDCSNRKVQGYWEKPDSETRMPFYDVVINERQQ